MIRRRSYGGPELEIEVGREAVGLVEEVDLVGSKETARKQKDQEAALLDCPIRTRYNPKPRRKSKRRSSRSSSRNSQSQLFDLEDVGRYGSRRASSCGLLASASRQTLSSDTVASYSRRASSISMFGDTAESAMQAAVSSRHPMGARRRSSDSSLCQLPTSSTQPIATSSAAKKIVQTAVGVFQFGIAEVGAAKNAFVEATLTSPQVISGPGAEAMIAELWRYIDARSRAGLPQSEKREFDVRAGLKEVIEMCGVDLNASDFNSLLDHGKFYCGADEAVVQAAKQPNPDNEVVPAVKEISATNQLEMFMKMAGKVEGKPGLLGKMLKHPLGSAFLEGMWRTMPGGQAIRRLPENHEAVYDFSECRISMPRYFGDEERDEEGDLVSRTAGQLISVHKQNNVVSLVTHAPRRVSNEPPCKIESVCDLKALGIETNKKMDDDVGLTHQYFNHLHINKLPPGNDEWLRWRELQTQKRREEFERKNVAKRVLERKSTGTVADIKGANGDDNEDLASTPRSMIGLDQVPGYAVKNGLDDLTALPWDARPHPTAHELDEIAAKMLPPLAYEARVARMAKAVREDETSREVAWTLRPAGQPSFELSFTMRQDPPTSDGSFSQGPLQHENQGDASAGDDYFWRDVFGQNPAQNAVPGCPVACSCLAKESPGRSFVQKCVQQSCSFWMPFEHKKGVCCCAP